MANTKYLLRLFCIPSSVATTTNSRLSLPFRGYQQLQSERPSFFMDDIEERPNKIRKLDTSSGPADPKHNEVKTVKETSVAKDPVLSTSQEPTEHGEVSVDADDQKAEEDTPKLSKSALKKLQKRERWAAGAEWRRARRKEKKQEKKARTAAEKTGGDGPKVEVKSVPPAIKRHQVQVPVTLIIDCDFDDLMTEKEIVSLAQQVTRSYSDNRSAPFRANMIISSFNKNLKKRFEEGLANTHLGWKATKITDKHYVEAAKDAQIWMESGRCGQLAGALLDPGAVGEETPTGTEEVDRAESEKKTATEPDSAEADTDVAGAVMDSNMEDIKNSKDDGVPKIIYLTSDSPHSLERIEANTSYVIGGIVDKNRHKGICYKRARDLGIDTAKLPIGEYMEMQSRTVLTTNHVVEIMLRWLEEGDWGKSFLRVIPKRKEAKLRKSARRDDDDEEGEEVVGEEVKEMVDEEEEDQDEERRASVVENDKITPAVDA